METTSTQQKGKTMTNATSHNACDAVITQAYRIQKAISLLQRDLDTLHDEIDPETANWNDVARFQHTADWSNEIITQYKEIEDTHGEYIP